MQAFIRAQARSTLACVLIACATGIVHAATPTLSAPASAPMPAPGALLPANTVVELELSAAVNSRTSRPGDQVSLRVASDVVLGGRVVIATGTPAYGQVVHAQKAGAGGKPGELILAARYLDLPQGRLKLRSNFGVAGARHSVASLVTAQFIGPFAMAVKGGEIDLPAGTRLATRTAEALDLRTDQTTRADAAAASTPSTTP